MSPTSNINPSIQHLAKPIKGLVHYDGNARKHDLPTVAASLKANGQYRPIVVRRDPKDDSKDNIVLAGNGTLAAARDLLGWEEIATTEVSCDDKTARRIVLIDNRASDLSSYDDELLAALLTDLNGDYLGTGYEEDDLTDLLDQLSAATGDPDGSSGIGEPVVAYQLVFDTEAQQNRWYEHLRTLRDRYPDAESIAERLVTHLDKSLKALPDPF